jgi:C4-dicarboxylate-specific signal transduction histidine kinase
MEQFVGSVLKQLRQQGTETMFSIRSEIIQAVELLGYKTRNIGADIFIESGADLETFGDQLKFSQAMVNLISNALDAVEEVPRHRRTIHIALNHSGNNACLFVADGGDGIPSNLLPDIFEPFVTTKGADSGTGLGLMITKEVIERCFEGSIRAESMKGSGTIFTIIFPIKTPGNRHETSSKESV